MEKPVLQARSSAQWEEALGRDLRTLRLRQNRTQADVARAANVSENAVRALELGQGSRVRTLIQVVRVLDREEWLTEVLPPEPSVSPLQLLREQRRASDSARVRASRSRGVDE